MAEVEPTPLPSPAPQPAPPSNFSTPNPGPKGRTIVTLMAVATMATLVSKDTGLNPIADTTGGARVIFGFTAGTVILVLISHLGDPGAEFAVGLATVTLASSLLANGDKLAKVITNLSAKTTPATAAKATTTKTTPAKAA
jgi:hypothetical protein